MDPHVEHLSSNLDRRPLSEDEFYRGCPFNGMALVRLSVFFHTHSTASLVALCRLEEEAMASAIHPARVKAGCSRVKAHDAT